MYFFIFFVLSFLSYFEFYFNKNYLFRIFIVFAVGVLFFVLMGYNSNSPDLELYKLHYEDLDQDYIKLSVEPFIYYLMSACKAYGLSFEGYQLIFSFLVFVLFIYSVFKYSPLPVFVFLNFFFIPFFPDITQIRFFLGFVIFIYSIQFFETKKWLFYSLFVVAILCHFSLITMLFFVILRRFDFFKNQNLSNIIIISITCLLFLIPKQIIEPILILLNPKYLLYTDSDAENVGTFLGTFVLYIPFFILNNLILWHYNNLFKADSIPAKYSKNIPVFIELVQFSNYIILFQYFIRDFSRISQNILIISSIYFSIVIYSLIERNRMLISKIIAISVLGSTILIYYIQFLMINNFKYFEVINRTFSSNYLFDSIFNYFKFNGI